MYWLDNNTGIPTAPTTPPVISAVKRYFTNGGAGVQPSVPEDFWFNMITDELLGVLDMAGIAPDKDDLGQLAKAIQSIAFSAYPVGAPIPWPTAVPPAGFLAMNGQSFSAATYPKLAAAYPSGVLIDLRAEFIRGWDGGRGIDSGRALISAQEATAMESTGLVDMGGGQYKIVTRPISTVSVGSANYQSVDFDSFEPIAASEAYPSVTMTPHGTFTGRRFRVRSRNVAFFYITRAA